MSGGPQIDLSRLAAAIAHVPAGYLILLNPGDEPWPRVCLFARDPDAGGSWYELFQFDCSDGVYEMGDRRDGDQPRPDLARVVEQLV